MSLKSHGADAWGRLVEQNVAQARHLRDRIAAEPRLELLAPVPLNVVCFRFTAPGLDGAALDAVNQEILIRVQERGIAVPSSTVLGGRFALRVAITNHLEPAGGAERRPGALPAGPGRGRAPAGAVGTGAAQHRLLPFRRTRAGPSGARRG